MKWKKSKRNVKLTKDVLSAADINTRLKLKKAIEKNILPAYKRLK